MMMSLQQRALIRFLFIFSQEEILHMQPYFHGLKVGMLLQLAIGPIFFFLLHAALQFGFQATLPGVFAVTLVDGLYISLAILGVERLLTAFPPMKLVLRLISIIVLGYLSWQFLLSGSGTTILLGDTQTIFWQLFWLTLSNPLGILFWASIFTRELSQHEFSTRGTWIFGLGALSATVLFLTFSIRFASVFQSLMTPSVMLLLNRFVGFCFAYFAWKMLWTLWQNHQKTIVND